MNINLYLEVTRDESELLTSLLSKELEETKIAVHHSKSHDYKDYLKIREEQLSTLLTRIDDAATVQV